MQAVRKNRLIHYTKVSYSHNSVERGKSRDHMSCCTINESKQKYIYKEPGLVVKS